VTRRGAGEGLPSGLRSALPQKADESQATVTASDFGEYTELGSRGNKVLLFRPKPDEATPSGEIVATSQTEVLSSQIFAAFFELELAGWARVEALGKNFARRLLFVFYDFRRKA